MNEYKQKVMKEFDDLYCVSYVYQEPTFRSPSNDIKEFISKALDGQLEEIKKSIKQDKDPEEAIWLLNKNK